jgi:hypothetical protein
LLSSPDAPAAARANGVKITLYRLSILINKVQTSKLFALRDPLGVRHADVPVAVRYLSVQYLVRWQDLDAIHDTWESEKISIHAGDLVDKFEAEGHEIKQRRTLLEAGVATGHVLLRYCSITDYCGCRTQGGDSESNLSFLT